MEAFAFYVAAASETTDLISPHGVGAATKGNTYIYIYIVFVLISWSGELLLNSFIKLHWQCHRLPRPSLSWKEALGVLVGVGLTMCLCLGGTSWIWPSCCCPSWASLWRRSRSTLPCPSTPPSSASWECWGLHEVRTLPPPFLLSIHPF